MAIATGTAIAIAAGAAAAGGAAKGIIGASRASKAKRAMDSFKRQELENVTSGLRVSTLGAQLQTQEAQRRFATSVDALRSGGVRGLVGGLGQINQQQSQVQAQIAADLDRQQMGIEQMRATDQANIRAMQEQRESFDFNMLAGQRAAGQQALFSGIGDVAGAIGFAAMNMPGAEGASAASGMFKQPELTNKIKVTGMPNMPFGAGSSSVKSYPTVSPLPPMNPIANPYTPDYLSDLGYNKNMKTTI
ncbi:MAG TPA: hypothetical protein DCY51_07475 [Bacteroidetes bacterium]|nr:hypothetical protein [Bacteroidota bacterium]